MGTPNDWTAYTDDYLSKHPHFTTGCPVSPGMKLLLHNYCLQTHISIWDCSFSQNYMVETPQLWWKFLDKMHSAYVNNFMQILVEIWPGGNSIYCVINLEIDCWIVSAVRVYFYEEQVVGKKILCL